MVGLVVRILLGAPPTNDRHVMAQAEIEFLSNALGAYRLDLGGYPTEAQGLSALRFAPDDVPAWHGPYVSEPVPLDPWGQRYVYRCSGPTFELISYGADGVAGGKGSNADLRREGK